MEEKGLNLGGKLAIISVHTGESDCASYFSKTMTRALLFGKGIECFCTQEE